MIDILLSTYNGEKYLYAQIVSIQKQTMQNWRLLVRDDGSTDNTIDILESFALTDKRILFLKDNKGNLGVVRSFEQLLYYSTANYIMFVDQDDVWLPNKIEHTLQAILKMETKEPDKSLLVFTDVFVVDSELKKISSSFIKREGYDVSVVTDVNRLAVSNCIMGCTVMINSIAKQFVLPFSKYTLMHDWWIGLIIAKYGKVTYLDEPTSLYRQHANNQVGSGKITFLYYLKRLCHLNAFFEVNYKYIRMIKDLPFKVNLFTLLVRKWKYTLCKFINQLI